MSTIERVAELLGPIERANSNFFASRGEGGIPEVVPIERIAGESAERSEFPDAGDLAAHLVALGLADESKTRSRHARPAGNTTQTLRVDRDQLRRQSMITPDGERTPSAESFRRVKRHILANVAKSKGDTPANLVMVTSALAGEGKTFCAINLAISIALEMDRTVLLVDADVAKPSVPQALGLKAKRGLMDVLLDRRIDLTEVLWKTDIGKLTLLPAGTALQHNTTELLASDAMRELLQEMAERYHDRILIFDSPPLLAASEAGVLASQMGQIVMVVEAGKTSEAELKAALGRIEASSVAGLLLNKVEGPGQAYHYGGYGKGGK